MSSATTFTSLKEIYPVTAENVKLFAISAGDPNPIHQDPHVAKEMGLEGPIAHGMFIYSYLLRRLDEFILEKEKSYSSENKKISLQLSETRCRFHGMVPVGQSFNSLVEISEENEVFVKVQLSLCNDKNEKLTHVIAKLLKKF